MKRQRLSPQTLIVLLMLLLLSVVLVACGTEAPPSELEDVAEMSQEMPASEAMASESPLPAATAPASADAAEAETRSGGEAGAVPAANPAQWSRKIIKNAKITLQAEGVFAVLNEATLISNQFGGYVVNARTWYEGDYPYAVYSFAVPVAQFELALEQIRQLGTVKNETTTGQDVTSQYVDLESRIRNLEATAARVRAFLEEADTVEEALRVNAELSSLESELEQLKGQLNVLSQQTAFSTINLEVVPVIPPAPKPEPVPEPGWSPLVTLNEALVVVVSGAQVLADGLIWVVVLVTPLALVLGPLWLVIRTLRRRQARSHPTHPSEV